MAATFLRREIERPDGVATTGVASGNLAACRGNFVSRFWTANWTWQLK
jgi:hypothetical protein